MTPWIVAGLGLMVVIGGAKWVLDWRGVVRRPARLSEEQEWAMRRACDPNLGNS